VLKQLSSFAFLPCCCLDLRQRALPCFFCPPATMVQIIISNTSPRVGYSSSLNTSCVSLQFWSAHEVVSTQASPTVSYCVTVPTPELVYTTPLDFYVCELQEFDVILGVDFTNFCLDSHCEHPQFLSFQQY
jgi:hypothetical protein